MKILTKKSYFRGKTNNLDFGVKNFWELRQKSPKIDLMKINIVKVISLRYISLREK